MNNFKIQNLRSQNKAFTLVEMLISISILMLFTGIVAGSFTSIVSANRRANDAQKLYRNIELVFSTIETGMRNGEIDFSCVGPETADPDCIENRATTKTHVFAFLQNGEHTLMRYSAAGAVEIKKQAGEWQSLVPAQEAANVIASADVIASEAKQSLQIKSLNFEVTPNSNPYLSANAANFDLQEQPRVTVILKAAGRTFKTTYTSRVYGKTNIYENK